MLEVFWHLDWNPRSTLDKLRFLFLPLIGLQARNDWTLYNCITESVTRRKTHVVIPRILPLPLSFFHNKCATTLTTDVSVIVISAEMITTERLDHVYMCKWCGRPFLFRRDVEVHKQQHEHTEYALLPLEEMSEALSKNEKRQELASNRASPTN